MGGTEFIFGGGMSLSSLKILIDSDLWQAKKLFSSLGEVICLSGRAICPSDLTNIDVLVIRSVTRVDEKLLKNNSSIKLILSVTAGFDHIDTEYLTLKKIPWKTMPGFNASPVGDYVLASLIRFLQAQLIPDRPRIAIVGVGSVGKQVQSRFEAIGADVVLCDPLRAKLESDFPHQDFQNLENIDIFCFHVPLTRGGEYPTLHFLEKSFLQKQKPGCVILNASRGEILKSNYILEFSRSLRFCLDVFENEPKINADLLSHVFMATPHIAGYSVQSKQRGMYMALEACAQFFELPFDARQIQFSTQDIILTKATTWQDVILKIIDPVLISQTFKSGLQVQGLPFDDVRKMIPLRVELAFTKIIGREYLDSNSELILKRLGFTLGD